MLVVTWNVNSLKARLPRVLDFLAVHQPEALCLQETKVTSAAFPHADVEAAGYRAIEHSAGQWTGVAILARADVEISDDVVRGLPGEPLTDDARWVEATVGGVRIASVYVVNGRSLDDPMFGHKLAFLDAMEQRLQALAGAPYIVAGDFNIAPADIDVYDPAAWEGSTHVTPEERGRLQHLLDTGCVDAYRYLHPEDVHYTWWDYRQGAFHRGWGMRIDLALVSGELAPRILSCAIDRDFRKGLKPSDHAPLLVELTD